MPNPDILFRGSETPNIRTGVQNALINSQNFNTVQQQPLRNRLLEANVGTAEQGLQQGEQKNNRAGVLAGLQAFKQYKTPEARRLAAPLIEEFVRSNFGVNFFDDKGADDLDLTDDEIDSMIAGLTSGTKTSAAQQEFNSLTANLSPEDKEKARRIELRLDPGAVGTGAITAATTEGLTEKVAKSEGTIEGEKARTKETEKLTVQRAMLPELEAEITKQVEAVKRDSTKIQAFDKKANDAKDVTELLTIAEPLLDTATESLGGVALDSLGKLVGLSNKGAEAAAQLRTLEGALILKMPRMEGPQSDRDQALYRQMAAQIGDATVPSEIRKASMSVLKQINKRYTTGKAGDLNKIQTLSDEELFKF